MAESQDRSVSISAKCDETQSNPQETRGDLTLRPIGGIENRIDKDMVGFIAEYLKKLQAAVAAHPQASEKRSYNEKEKKIHEALTTANRIISEILGLIGSPQSRSPEKLVDLVNGLTSTIEIPDIDVDHVEIHSLARLALTRPWGKAGQKKDRGIKAILQLIASLATFEKRRVQDLQRLTEEKRQALSVAELKERRLLLLESIQYCYTLLSQSKSTTR